MLRHKESNTSCSVQILFDSGCVWMSKTRNELILSLLTRTLPMRWPRESPAVTSAGCGKPSASVPKIGHAICDETKHCVNSTRNQRFNIFIFAFPKTPKTRNHLRSSARVARWNDADAKKNMANFEEDCYASFLRSVWRTYKLNSRSVVVALGLLRAQTIRPRVHSVSHNVQPYMANIAVLRQSRKSMKILKCLANWLRSGDLES